MEAYPVPNEQAVTVAEKPLSGCADMEPHTACTVTRAPTLNQLCFKGCVNCWGKHSTTGLTPNVMLFGREITEPIDLVAGLPLDIVSSNTHPQYVQQLRERLDLSHQLARKVLGTTKHLSGPAQSW